MTFIFLENLNPSEYLESVASRHLKTARVLVGILMFLLLLFLGFSQKPWARQQPSEKGEEGIIQAAGQGPSSASAPAAVKHRISQWFYYAAAVNAMLCALLVLAAGWWAKPVADLDVDTGGSLIVDAKAWWDSDWWFWLIITIVALLAIGLRWQLAHGSLSREEAQILKPLIAKYQPAQGAGGSTEQPGKGEFQRGSPYHAFWSAPEAVNYLGFGVLSRFFLTAWQALGDRQLYEFSELVMRFPSLLAGVLSVFLTGVLLRNWGFAWPGIFTAFFLAIHPWHIRYSVDARGFSLATFFALLGVYFLTHALRRGSWGYWLFWALAQMLMLWILPYMFSVYLTFLAFAGVGIFYYHSGNFAFKRLLGRFLAVSLFVVMFFIQFIIPWYLQIKDWNGLIELSSGSLTSLEFINQLWCNLSVGFPSRLIEQSADFSSVKELMGTLPLPFLLLFWIVLYLVVPVLTLSGAIRLSMANSTGGLAVLPLFFATPLLLLQAYYKPYFSEASLLLALPALGMCIFLGATTLFSGRRGLSPATSYAQYIAMSTICLGFLLISFPQMRLLQRHPYMPLRNVAAHLHLNDLADSTTDSSAQHGVIRAGCGKGGQILSVYDPFVSYFETLDELRKLSSEAQKSNKTLYVFYGFKSVNELLFPEIFSYLNQGGYFKPVAEFQGIEPSFSYTVLSYTGKSFPESAASSPGT